MPESYKKLQEVSNAIQFKIDDFSDTFEKLDSIENYEVLYVENELGEAYSLNKLAVL